MTMFHQPLKKERTVRLQSALPLAEFGKAYDTLFNVREHVQVMSHSPVEDDSSDSEDEDAEEQQQADSVSERKQSTSASGRDHLVHFKNNVMYDIGIAYNGPDAENIKSSDDVPPADNTNVGNRFTYVV